MKQQAAPSPPDALDASRMSMDFFVASTVGVLRAGLEAEWASLLERGHAMLELRSRHHPSSAHHPTGTTNSAPGPQEPADGAEGATGSPTPPLAAGPPPVAPLPASPRVTSLRWADSGEELQDAHLSHVAQRPLRWSRLVVGTSSFTTEVYLGSATDQERLLFLASSSSQEALIARRRAPPRREEYRRTAKTCRQLLDEARRVFQISSPDAALPAHWTAVTAADGRGSADVRLEILSFLLQHDCKARRIPPCGGEDLAANVERMAADLELCWVRQNPIHVVKFSRFDYAMEFRRLLELPEERQYTSLRSTELTRWVTTEFWDAFTAICGGSWVEGSLAADREPSGSREELLAWRPCKKPLQELWKKCAPRRYSFPFYFELLEDHQLIENIHDKIVEMATMVRTKLGAHKLPLWNSSGLPFVVSGITRLDSHERIDNETLRNDLKRNSSAMLRYEIFAPRDGAGHHRQAAANDDLSTKARHDAQWAADQAHSEGVAYERVIVRRGPLIGHPLDRQRKVRMVQVMSLRGDTLDSGLETIKYIRKSMHGKRERAQRDTYAAAGSGPRLWEYSIMQPDAQRMSWFQYGIQLQDRLNGAWLSGEGCDWTTETQHKSLDRLVPNCSGVKNAMVIDMPAAGPTLIGFQEPPSGNGIHVEMSTGFSTQARGRRMNFAERLRRLEGMALILHRKRVKTHFRARGLFVSEVAPDNQSKRIFIVITAANHKFAQLAEATKLRCRLSVNPQTGKFLGDFVPEMFLRGGPLLEFWRDTPQKRHPYKWFWLGASPHDPGDCFTSADRLKMLNELIHADCSDGVQLRIAELQANDVVTRFFPLHDEDTVEYLRAHWARPWQMSLRGLLRQPLHQDIDTIRDYFGVHIAFYFEWLGFYTKWLMAPTALGVLIYFSKTVLQADYFKGTLHVEQEHDLYPYFALFMALWATLFLEFWKRRSRMLVYQWDIQPQTSVDHVRPKFVSNLRARFSEDTLLSHLRNIIPSDSSTLSAFNDTNVKMDLAQYDEVLYYPPVHRTLKHMVTYPLMLAMIVGLGTGMAWIYVGGLFLDYDAVKAQFAAGATVNDAWKEEIAPDRYYALVGIANGVAIPILNVLYKRVAVRLTEWELHRTFSEYNEALALKLFMFQFVNSYASLFFIAFHSRSFYRLQYQLFFVMFVGQVIQNFMELAMPALMRKLRSIGANGTAIARAAGTGRPSRSSIDDSECTKIQNESVAKVYDDFALSEDYLEMTIQFGFATMFVVANPLVPLLALVNNLIEIRIDASKLCYLAQRPEPRSAVGIGLWQQILQFMAMLAVVTNFAIIVYTKVDSGQACDESSDECTPAAELPTLMDVLLKCDEEDGVFPCRSMDNLLIALLLEHLVVLLRFVCSTVMLSESSKPRSICADEFKESYYHLKSKEMGSKLGGASTSYGADPKDTSPPLVMQP